MRVRPFFCMSTLATAALCTASTFAGGSSCCIPNGGLGCDDPVCQDAVCAVDPFCCSIAWDTICAGEAASLCGDLCGGGGGTCPPSSNDCCFPGSGPGCADTACCEAVCAVDGFCCSVAWDGICAGEAGSLCPDLCAGSTPCGNSTNDCCAAGAGPGCSDAACCEAVCAIDPFCCSVAWDSICAGEAQGLCFELCGGDCDTTCPPGGYVEAEGCGEDTNGGCNAPPISGSNCCIANGGIGCDNLACQEIVCAVDGFCCSIAWDGICAAEAASLCGDLCATATAYEAITCGTTVCGTFWADGSFRDTDWYSFSLSAPTLVTWSVSAAIPATIALLDNNCPPFIFEIVTVQGCPSEISYCLDAGTYTAFVAPGFFNGLPCGSGDANNYLATLICGDTCEPLACGSTSAGDCCVAGSGPYCNDADCCNAVCAVDSFCCAVAWDGICAQEAAIICLELCGPDCDLTCSGTTEAEGCGEDTNGGCNAPPISGSNCCTANGGIGCDNIDCQTAVCAVDGFCCSIAWDGICAAEAASLCGDLCAAASAYEAIECGETICGTFWADGSFRDTDWYSFSLASTTDVTWSVRSVVPMTLALLDSNCPPFIFVITTVSGCPAEVSWCLDAGDYTAFVAPGFFNGLPCGAGEANNYVASLICGGSCEPLGCGSPDAGDCCTANGTPFCNDEECCTIVCSVDPFCCSVAWDGICASEAGDLCTICQFGAPANDECAGAFTVVDGGNAVTTQGATGQTDLPAECDSFGSVSVFNDVWYTYTATATGTVTVSTCNTASFDTRLAVFSGSCAEPVFVACNDDGAGCAGFTSLMTFDAVCGEKYLIVLGAFGAGVTGTGTMTITPSGECPAECIADLDGDGDVDAADLAILLGQWGGTGSANLDGVGVVDAADLAILLGEWGDC
jgi:hypothetical protein